MTTVGSLFSGMGGIDLGFMQSGFDVSWSVELDRSACDTLNFNFNHKIYQEDVRKISNLSYVDVVTSGFPCQPYSITGKRQGFSDPRSNLFFETIRLIQQVKPKMFLLENVSGLLTLEDGSIFKTMLDKIESIDYKYLYVCLNSKDYSNIPQNRNRLYVVGYKLDLIDKLDYNDVFPQKIKLTNTIQDILEPSFIQQNSKYYYTKSSMHHSVLYNNIQEKNTIYQYRRSYVRKNMNGLCPTLTGNMGTGGNNVPLVLDEFGIRKITPKECLRFQGFPENFKFPNNISNTQCYKQIGNSVTVPVLKNIADKLLKLL